MAVQLGMDTGKARGTRSALQAQLHGLSGISADLGATRSAALYPQFYGITPGETTVAPWSVGSLESARAQIISAQSAAGGLLERLLAEADSQDVASSNEAVLAALSNVAYTAYDWTKTGLTILDTGDDISTVLQLPATFWAVSRMPGALGAGLNPASWGLTNTLRATGQLDTLMRSGQAPRWIESMYKASGRFEFQNYFKPAAFTDARHAAHWTDMMSPGALSGVQKGAAVLGKGLAILSVAEGAYTLGKGVVGALDGDVSSDDAWNMADGAVNTITSIGSFAPPPVGVVFAGVGVAYNAGRWLFGEDDGGKTGIDHISDGLNATGKFLGEVGENAAAGRDALVRGAAVAATQAAGDVMNNAKDLANTAGAVASVAGNMANDAMGNAAKVADDLWPW